MILIISLVSRNSQFALKVKQHCKYAYVCIYSDNLLPTTYHILYCCSAGVDAVCAFTGNSLLLKFAAENEDFMSFLLRGSLANNMQHSSGGTIANGTGREMSLTINRIYEQTGEGYEWNAAAAVEWMMPLIAHCNLKSYCLSGVTGETPQLNT